MKPFLAALGLLAAGATATPASNGGARTSSADKVIVKLATLVPDGSVWDKSFRTMAEEWSRDTAGRVRMRIYSGGVAGDEPDIVRKMRIGQLTAASLTVSGMGEIDDAFKLFEVPLFFESYEELTHVVRELSPMLEERLAAKGFVLLHWGHTGWIHIFSTAPVRTLDDLRSLKLFVWGGNNRMVQWWKENGFQPVPLAATDVLPGLKTGMIESVPTTPIAALTLQWFRSAPYMTEMGIMPYLGATVMTEKAWGRISESDRVLLLDAARKAEEHLFEEVPAQEERAIAEMEKRGLTVTPSGDNEAAFREAAQSFADKMGDTIVPADVLELAREVRDAYRRGKTAGSAAPVGEKSPGE